VRPTEGDQADVIAPLIDVGEQVEGRALGDRHPPLRRHRAARVHDEEDAMPGGRLAVAHAHILGADLYRHFIAGLSLKARSLMHCRRPDRRRDGERASVGRRRDRSSGTTHPGLRRRYTASPACAACPVFWVAREAERSCGRGVEDGRIIVATIIISLIRIVRRLRRGIVRFVLALFLTLP
jgi:hypothetical protein